MKKDKKYSLRIIDTSRLKQRYIIKKDSYEVGIKDRIIEILKKE